MPNAKIGDLTIDLAIAMVGMRKIAESFEQLGSVFKNFPKYPEHPQSFTVPLNGDEFAQNVPSAQNATCNHDGGWLDITTFGDPEPQMMCSHCGVKSAAGLITAATIAAGTVHPMRYKEKEAEEKQADIPIVGEIIRQVILVD